MTAHATTGRLYRAIGAALTASRRLAAPTGPLTATAGVLAPVATSTGDDHATTVRLYRSLGQALGR